MSVCEGAGNSIEGVARPGGRRNIYALSDDPTFLADVLLERLQNRPPGGGRAMPGGAAGRDTWQVFCDEALEAKL